MSEYILLRIIRILSLGNGMAKRLCKMSRKQIAENLGDIHRLVVEPQFMCRSCARSSASKGSLCKPAAIPPQQCQSQPIEQQRACGLLAEALPEQAAPTKVKDEQKAQAVRRVIDRVKEKSARATVTAPSNETEIAAQSPLVTSIDISDKKALKKAKKALKKHYKQQKKLLKLAKKQHKLLKRQRRLEEKLDTRSDVPNLLPGLLEVQNESKVH